MGRAFLLLPQLRGGAGGLAQGLFAHAGGRPAGAVTAHRPRVQQLQREQRVSLARLAVPRGGSVSSKVSLSNAVVSSMLIGSSRGCARRIPRPGVDPRAQWVVGDVLVAGGYQQQLNALQVAFHEPTAGRCGRRAMVAKASGARAVLQVLRMTSHLISGRSSTKRFFVGRGVRRSSVSRTRRPAGYPGEAASSSGSTPRCSSAPSMVDRLHFSTR